MTLRKLPASHRIGAVPDLHVPLHVTEPLRLLKFIQS